MGWLTWKRQFEKQTQKSSTEKDVRSQAAKAHQKTINKKKTIYVDQGYYLISIITKETYFKNKITIKYWS